MSHTLHLFQAFGVELEYMIVGKDTLDVLPYSDKLLCSGRAPGNREVRMGRFGWSNELVMHVIEIKTNGPAASLTGIDKKFHEQVQILSHNLAPHDAMLLPTGMHPWMNPNTDTSLWLFDDREIYEAFDRIFNCSGHGWSNLQSVHLNLPFSGDVEFRKLHSAIRLILPLIPALAASSPIKDSTVTGLLDTRLDVYRMNCARIPQITGRVIPEVIHSETDYRQQILEPMYQAIKPHDPDNILQDEWLNARGAIARFDRNAIEIRVIDIQECPKADCAILQFIVLLLTSLTSGKLSTIEAQESLSTEALQTIFLDTLKGGFDTALDNSDYARAFGVDGGVATTGELIDVLLDQHDSGKNDWADTLRFIRKHGNLAQRILKATGRQPNHSDLTQVYSKLSNCLLTNTLFEP